MQLTPEVYNEIRQSMEHHDYVSVRAEALREGEAIGEARGEVTGGLRQLHNVAQRLKDRGVPAAEIAETSGVEARLRPRYLEVHARPLSWVRSRLDGKPLGFGQGPDNLETEP